MNKKTKTSTSTLNKQKSNDFLGDREDKKKNGRWGGHIQKRLNHQINKSKQGDRR